MAKKLRPWPADSVERWALSRISEYPGNPMVHSDEQIELIAESMRTVGVTDPVLVDEQGVLIAGHGRLQAAQRAGLRELPVCVARGWSEAEKRAHRIWDNQSARLANWNLPYLKLELDFLRQGNFDMPRLGFPGDELLEIELGQFDGETAESERELSAAEQKRLDAAWRLLVKKWQKLWLGARDRGYASPTFIREALIVHFVRAQLHGHEIPRNATISYCLHRMSEVGDSGSLDEVFKRALEDDGVLHGLQFIMGGLPSFDKLFTGLAVHGHRMPQEFPALLARDLIREFCPKGGAVLDPCHGWGGRLLGFLLSDAREYFGVDASEQTVKGVQAIAADLLPFAIGKRKIKLINSPFEDMTIRPGSFGSRSFDFALTSPPYFNTEKYSGEQSSWRRYRDYDTWRDKFYEPMIAKVADALKDGAVFALQVGSQAFPLEADCKAIGPKHKLVHELTRETEIVNNQMGHTQGEVVIILRKQERAARRVAKVDPALEYGRVL